MNLPPRNPPSIVEQTSDLPDASDIRVQLNELKSLREGWFDGDGQAFDAESLNRLAADLLRWYPSGVAMPYIYPTPDGNVQVEWTLGKYEAVLEIDPLEYSAYWHWLDVSADISDGRDLDMGATESWHLWSEELQRLGAPAR
jgi:hypothetical protein